MRRFGPGSFRGGFVGIALVAGLFACSVVPAVTTLADEPTQTEEAVTETGEDGLTTEDSVDETEVGDQNEVNQTTSSTLPSNETPVTTSPTSTSDSVPSDDASDDSEGDEMESSSTYSGGEFIGNSWRYVNGLLKDGNVSLLAGTSGISWTKDGDDYVGSNGVRVEGANAIGIDVSEHQGTIDWAAVKNAGIDFAIIRCGYGSAGTDNKFIENVRGCQKNGIPFGIYFYSYAWDYETSLPEAENALRLLKEAGLDPDDLKLPVFLDMENEGAEGGKYYGIPCGIDMSGKEIPIKSEDFAGIAEAFCDTLQESGYTVGIYANKNWFTNYLTDPVFDTWMRWVAQYSGTGSTDYDGEYGWWQCTSKGRVDGTSGDVDINFSYVGGLVWDARGLRYAQQDGTPLRSDWAEVDGSRYYFPRGPRSTAPATTSAPTATP